MNTPQFLVGATLMFWGWQTEHLILASIMAFVLEGSRFIKMRWDFSASDFNRISDLCSILFLGTVVYIYILNRSAYAILLIFQWLPMITFPLLASQAYSTVDGIDIGAFFWTLRKKAAKEGHIPRKTVNLLFPYVILCILSTSAANVRTIWFYAGLLFLSAWALWCKRSKRFSPVLWVSLFILAGVVGHVGHMGLHNLQLTIEKKGLEWFADFIRQDADPYRSMTAIGDIGELKLSDCILFRVKPGFESARPILLREASYNIYTQTGWFALLSKFVTVNPGAEESTRVFQPDKGRSNSIIVSALLRKGKGMLKLPNGTFRIENLPFLKMMRNRFGAVKVEEGPGLLNYGVRFDRYASLDSPPEKADLSVPEREAPPISQISNALELTAKSSKEILKSVDTFFNEKFTYSLILDNKRAYTTPLADFLLRSRSGHCEYFATATVLILRGAGIPSRYVSGYSVQEFSRLENRFIVRARHAHAWALAYIDGRWQDFDTTPSSWVDIENNAASIWEPFYDIWSLLFLKFSEWRWLESKGEKTRYIVWLLIPLILILARRFYLKTRIKRIKTEDEQKARSRPNPGSESDFYLIEKRLNESGFVRYPWETPSCWIKRIKATDPANIASQSLDLILTLHYRYRFDPKGISIAEKETLKSGVISWLEENKKEMYQIYQGKSVTK